MDNSYAIIIPTEVVKLRASRDSKPRAGRAAVPLLRGVIGDGGGDGIDGHPLHAYGHWALLHVSDWLLCPLGVWAR